MRVVTKEVALALLAEHKQSLLASGASCVMCELAKNGGEGCVAESRHAVVMLDRFACRYGHLMVIPRRHVERMSDIDWEVFVDVQRLVFEAGRAVEACFKPARVFTATLGAAAELPQTYSHYHVHVIPVFETDERARPARVLSWSEGVVIYDDEEASEVCRQLVAGWPRPAHDAARR